MFFFSFPYLPILSPSIDAMTTLFCLRFQCIYFAIFLLFICSTMLSSSLTPILFIPIFCCTLSLTFPQYSSPHLHFKELHHFFITFFNIKLSLPSSKVLYIKLLTSTAFSSRLMSANFQAVLVVLLNCKIELDCNTKLRSQKQGYVTISFINSPFLMSSQNSNKGFRPL